MFDLETTCSRMDEYKEIRQYWVMQPGLSMQTRFVILTALLAWLWLALLEQTANGAPDALPLPATRQIDFVQDIQPILTNSCYECHGAEKQKGGLRLDQKAAAFKGGDSGPVLVPGKS